MATLGSSGDPVGWDQGAVQTQEGLPAGAGAGQHVAQVGSVVGDHLERLVQIPETAVWNCVSVMGVHRHVSVNA